MRKIFLVFVFFAVLFLFADKSNIFSSSHEAQKTASEFAKGFQAAFGSQKGDSRYDAEYDINADGRISAADYPISSLKTASNKNQKGYILEFKDAPLAQQKAKGKGEVQILDYKTSLLSRHEEAKKDILGKLGKKRFVSASSATIQEKISAQDAVVILGEYTNAFNGIALDINEKQTETLKDSPYVKRIAKNNQVKAFLNESVPLIKAPEVWNINDSQGKPVTGQGVKIAIIDTGIDYTHQDFGGCTKEQFLNKQCTKVVGGYDFFNRDNDPMDDHGHGTHVASTAGGNGTLKGVAPAASLVAYKVLSQWGYGWDSDILAAIEAVMLTRLNNDTTDDIDIMNFSLGGWGDPADPLSLAVDQSAETGVVSAISAGNSGPAEQSIGSPGLANKAITVGATDKTPKMADFSSQGPVIQMLDLQNEIIKPNLVAPGVNICAARANIVYISASASVKEGGTTPDCGSNYVFKSGTSMAAPHVAGAAALLKQLYPSWTPEEIKGALMSLAENLGESPFTQGSGMLNVAKSAQTNSLVTPGSLSFGFVDRSTRNTTLTKELTIKNLKKATSYSLFLNTGMPMGAEISFSENNFSLNPSESKTIQVRLNIDNEALGEGLYVSQITIAEDGVETYRLPVAFFKKAILLLLDRQTSTGSVFAKVITPYVGLSSAPILEITAPSGQKSTASLTRSFDLTSWQSKRINLSENGTYSFFAVAPQMRGYSATASLKVDSSLPNFAIKANRSNGFLNVQVDPSEKINESFTKSFLNKQAGIGHNYRASILAESNNTYLTYKQHETNKLYFQKSKDNGATWEEPLVLAEFPEYGYSGYSSLAKLNGKLFVAFTEGVRDSRSSLLKVRSSSDGTNWSNPITVAENVNATDLRTFAFKAGNGKLHFVYGAFGENDMQLPIYYQNSSDGGNWSNPYKLGETPRWTDLDMDINDQEIRIVYLKNKLTKSEDERNIVYYATSRDGNNWNTRVLWESVTANILMYPSILSYAGKTYIVLNRLEDGQTLLLIRLDNQNNGLIIKENITGVEKYVYARSFLPRLGHNLGKLYLAWTDFNWDDFSSFFVHSLHLRRSENEGESWGEDIFSDNNTYLTTEIATDGRALYLTWPSFEGEAFRIAFARNPNLLADIQYKTNRLPLELTKSGDSFVGTATWQGEGLYSINVSGADPAGNFGATTKSFDFPQAAAVPLSVKIAGVGNPLNRERTAAITVFDENKVQKKTTQTTLVFNGSAYDGTANLSDLPQGAYYLTVKLNNSLSKLVSGVPFTIAGSKITVQGGGGGTILTMGDVNNNDSVDINDYYKLISCFGATTSSARWNNDCEFSDFYDDGRVSVVDYSVLVTYYGRKGDALTGLPGALTKPQTTNTSNIVYVETKIGCSNPQGLTPNQICQKQGYVRSVETAGTAASGYWWKQCGGASVSSCQGLNCTVNKLDCTNTPGYWGSQQPYPARYKKAGKNNTIYRPTELGFSCRGYSPGWTMRVACETK